MVESLGNFFKVYCVALTPTMSCLPRQNQQGRQTYTLDKVNCVGLTPGCYGLVLTLINCNYNVVASISGGRRVGVYWQHGEKH